MTGGGKDRRPSPAKSCFFFPRIPFISPDLRYHHLPPLHFNNCNTNYGNSTENLRTPSSFNNDLTLNQQRPFSTEFTPRSYYQYHQSPMFGSIPVCDGYMRPPLVIPSEFPMEFPLPREREVGRSLPETDEGYGPVDLVENDSSSSESQEGDFPSKLSTAMEESTISELRDEIGELGGLIDRGNYSLEKALNDLDEKIHVLLNLGDDHVDKNYSNRYEDYRSDTREEQFPVNGQCRRMFKSGIQCRRDIDQLNVPFFDIYESLLPSIWEEDQKHLITRLERIVRNEWPESRLKLYGSCANSFAFSNCNIHISLEIEDPLINNSEVLLKLAQILHSHNFQNVQSLTRARVPIVKFVDPFTWISCDISVNNSLAVVNTKLLRDYAQIDIRLQQLVFIVKHWAKSRKVNDTSQGTLSSYAYVLMCIHFLQSRKPAILPCLQQMRWTYEVSVGSIICAYYDKVDKLDDFGSANKETIGQLVWEFFKYWAYGHDYTSEVISVRTGRTLSKRSKNWKKSIGNDRHLICIEDPFDKLQDLGRVVDCRTIHALREEFERAAEIMQFDPNPCVKLFEPYIPGC